MIMERIITIEKINDYVIFNVEGVFQNYKWNGATYTKVDDRKVKSFNFGKYDSPARSLTKACAIDSLYENDMTAISGKAGSGKSTLALYVAMNLIEKHKYNRLIIMSNPLPLRGRKRLVSFLEVKMTNCFQQTLEIF